MLLSQLAETCILKFNISAMNFFKRFVIPFLIACILCWVAYKIGKGSLERFGKRKNANIFQVDERMLISWSNAQGIQENATRVRAT